MCLPGKGWKTGFVSVLHPDFRALLLDCVHAGILKLELVSSADFRVDVQLNDYSAELTDIPDDLVRTYMWIHKGDLVKKASIGMEEFVFGLSCRGSYQEVSVSARMMPNS